LSAPSVPTNVGPPIGAKASVGFASPPPADGSVEEDSGADRETSEAETTRLLERGGRTVSMMVAVLGAMPVPELYWATIRLRPGRSPEDTSLASPWLRRTVPNSVVPSRKVTDPVDTSRELPVSFTLATSVIVWPDLGALGRAASTVRVAKSGDRAGDGVSEPARLELEVET
jgi:hypothetical protein